MGPSGGFGVPGEFAKGLTYQDNFFIDQTGGARVFVATKALPLSRSIPKVLAFLLGG